MRNSRLFEIVYLLLEKRSMTAQELSRRLEVSVRTIYRDVDALCAAGIPIYAQRGGGGGIRLMEQFMMDRALLSEREQDEILFALQSLRATGAAGDEGTLERLRTLFRREGTDWLTVDFSDWGSGLKEKEVFDTVKEGILSRRRLFLPITTPKGAAASGSRSPCAFASREGTGTCRHGVFKKRTFAPSDSAAWRALPCGRSVFCPGRVFPKALSSKRAKPCRQWSC